MASRVVFSPIELVSYESILVDSIYDYFPAEIILTKLLPSSVRYAEMQKYDDIFVMCKGKVVVHLLDCIYCN